MERTVRGEKRPRSQSVFTLRITTERECHFILFDEKELEICISSKTPVTGILPPVIKQCLGHYPLCSCPPLTGMLLLLYSTLKTPQWSR